MALNTSGFTGFDKLPMQTIHKRSYSIPDLLIGVTFLICLVVGFLVAQDYGESWDEQLRYRYAERSLDAYRGELRYLQDEKGPFFVMLAKLGADVLVNVLPNRNVIEARHLMHFLSFLLGVFFFYRLCRRVVDPPAAVAGSLLFLTQPLLWGHAYINPKDIPFMTFFLGSMLFGLELVDHQPSITLPGDLKIQGFGVALAADRDSNRRKWQNLILGLAALGLLCLLFLIVTKSPIQDAVIRLVTAAYSAPPGSLLGNLFGRLVDPANRLPLERYIEKALLRYPGLVMTGLAAWVAVSLCAASLVFPATRRRLWVDILLPFGQACIRSLRHPTVWWAGLFLGFASAIRVIGPLSGLLSGTYFVYRRRRQALPTLAGVFSLGLLVTYLVWPGLWHAPLDAFLRSSNEAAAFTWEGKVLFAGQDYAAGELPWYYLPVLFALQFTEPALILFGLGVVLAGRGMRSGRLDPGICTLLGIWLLGPPLLAILTHATIYDNFRHFLFVTPPLFIIASFGLQAAWKRLPRLAPWLAVLALLPGLYHLIDLHPYQYIYYNSLAGGVSGAFRRFEMDYWATSYRQATEFINQTAPNGSMVVVWGPDHIVARYARIGLNIQGYNRARDGVFSGPVFAVISSRHNKDQTLYPDAPVLFQVTRSGAVLAVVKQVQQTGPPQP